MQQLMQQMGIKSEELSAKSVVIETEDSKLIIDNPQVTRITMQGQTSFQIAGEVRKEEGISQEDVKMVTQQAEVPEEQAAEALKESGGDIAAAILKLKGEESKE
jgi:nascent polypeptide-associated complex subunit alpha